MQLSVTCATEARRLADRVVNLSAGGARIATPTPLATGSKHRFFFIVPDAKAREAIIDVVATVAWSTLDAMGLAFDQHVGGIDDYVGRLERSAHSR